MFWVLALELLLPRQTYCWQLAMADTTLQSASPVRIYGADISWLPPRCQITMLSTANEALRNNSKTAANLMADGRVTHVLMVRTEPVQEEGH